MVMQIVAWVASLLVFGALFMKTMLPLRIVAIFSNVTFITYALLGAHYGLFDKVYPILILHTSLLPLNIIRLRQIKALIKKIDKANNDDFSISHLLPYMKKEKYSHGTILFRKGDKGDKIFFVSKGKIKLEEVGKTLQEGSVMGEVGIFSPDNKRAATATCIGICELLTLHRKKVYEIYYQNPHFGFFLVRSLSKIVSENAEKMSELSKPIKIGAKKKK